MLTSQVGTIVTEHADLTCSNNSKSMLASHVTTVITEYADLTGSNSSNKKYATSQVATLVTEYADLTGSNSSNKKYADLTGSNKKYADLIWESHDYVVSLTVVIADRKNYKKSQKLQGPYSLWQLLAVISQLQCFAWGQSAIWAH